jgi:hypothetical protein
MFDYDLYDVAIEKVIEYQTPSGNIDYYNDEPRSRIEVPGVAERRYIKTLFDNPSFFSQIKLKQNYCYNMVLICFPKFQMQTLSSRTRLYLCVAYE